MGGAVGGEGEEGPPSPFTLGLINQRPINPAGASLAGRSGTQKGSGGLRTTTALMLMLIILVEKKKKKSEATSGLNASMG